MSESIFNEGSIDVDFRIEGNGSTHAFFVEGETDRVGLLTSDPTHTLVVKTDSGGSTNVLKIEEKDSTDTLVQLSFGGDYDEGSIHVYNGGTSKINLRGNGSSYINGGSLGIGTDSPQALTHIKGADTVVSGTYGEQLLIEDTAAYNAAQYAGISFKAQYHSNGSVAHIAQIVGDRPDTGSGTYNGQLYFLTRTSGSDLEKALTLDYNQNATFEGNVSLDGYVFSNGATNTGRASRGNVFKSSANGNAAITLLSPSNISAGVGEDMVALNFAANNYWADAKDSVYGQIRCEGGNGSYADRGQLVFATAYNGATIYDRMVINFDGYIGIGTMTPGENVHIVSGAAAATTLKIEATSTGERADLNLYGVKTDNGGFAEILFVNGGDSTGAIACERSGANDAGDIVFTTQATGGGMTARGKFASGGDFYTNDGSVSSLSDKRTKKDITDLEDGLSIVNQLKPKTFKYNGKTRIGADDGKTRYGFIADDVLEVANQYVEINKEEIDGVEVDDFKSLSMIRMFPMLVKAVQELSTKVTALEGN